jgi:hypothetical protein
VALVNITKKMKSAIVSATDGRGKQADLARKAKLTPVCIHKYALGKSRENVGYLFFSYSA